MADYVIIDGFIEKISANNFSQRIDDYDDLKEKTVIYKRYNSQKC